MKTSDARKIADDLNTIRSRAYSAWQECRLRKPADKLGMIHHSTTMKLVDRIFLTVRPHLEKGVY